MRKIRHFNIFLLMFASLMGVTNMSFAQGAAAAIFGPEKPGETAAEPEKPKDALGRETPRGTLAGFIEALSKSDYEKAASYLNLSYLPKTQAVAQGPVFAKDLQILMDNGAWIVPTSMASDDVLGNENDGLSAGVERLGTLRADKNEADLLAERITGPDDVSIWLISTETVKKIPAMTKRVTMSWIDRVLPDQLLKPKLAGVPVGHWVAMLGLMGVSYILCWGLVRLLVCLTRKCWKNTSETGKKHVIDAFELPVTLYATTWVFVISAIEIGISIVARQYFSRLTIIVAWLSLALLMWKLIDVVAETMQKKLILKGKYGALSGVHFFRRTAKFIFLAIAIFVTLSNIGVDVTAALAALGIGGLALAFGAQKTVENFIGSIMVIFDQPVRIGDYCQVGEIQGTIEDIGMRSTRIRTLERTVITIPNGEFSSQRIENFAHRDQFRFYTTIPLRFDTTPGQVRYLLVEIRSLLFSHPRIDPKSANVKFIGWSDDALVLELSSYIATRSNDDFMEVREDILLRIMDIIKSAGTDLALPSQLLYMARAPHNEENESQKAAEQKVSEMTEKGGLPLPKFDAKQIEELRNSVEYPPKGSVSYKSKKE